MNNQRKRELKEAHRTSRPPMGVLSFRCVPTGERDVYKRQLPNIAPTLWNASKTPTHGLPKPPRA